MSTAVAEQTHDDVVQRISDAVPGAVVGTWADSSDASLIVAPDRFIDTLTHLRDEEGYDYLSSVTGVDYLSFRAER